MPRKPGRKALRSKQRAKPAALWTRTARGINGWLCLFTTVDNVTEPAREREPMSFTEIYLAQVSVEDFRKNPRGELGTRTATLHREGILKLRQNWIYKEKL
jgi:hypothetical protein